LESAIKDPIQTHKPTKRGSETKAPRNWTYILSINLSI
jgi:hypothetical protein